MRILKQLYMIALCIGVATLTCEYKKIVDSQRTLQSQVQINLKALQRTFISGQQLSGVSVADSAILIIEPQNGNRQEHGRKLAQGDSIITFDITVKTGTVQFTANILSNNGSLIYSGERSLEVSKDGFVVEIPLTAQDAILAVFPDSLVATPSPYAKFFVENKGVKNLDWWIDRITSLDNVGRDSCLLFSPNSGGISKNEATVVTVIPWQAYPGETFVVRIGSNVGHVEIKIRRDIIHEPDLVITTLDTTGPASINAQQSVEVPIRVIVRNQGDAAAGVFKVATEYTGPQGTFAVAFTVPGQSSTWYPYTNSALAPGSSVTFIGKVVFYSSVHKVTVSLKAIADSCSGDEFMPDYCRVDESNEDNNESAPLLLLLP